MTGDAPITGRCYCGQVALRADAAPQIVAYCHCADCRRWTGAPLPAFAAFAPADLQVTPPLAEPFSAVPGVDRWTCPACGSPVAATFDYLPGQVYVPLGLLDQAAQLAPQQHCHAASQMPWLHLDDGLDRATGSARNVLTGGHRAV